MSTFGDVLANGPAIILEHDGKEYPVAYLGQDQKAAFESHLRRKALAALEDMEAILSPEDFASEKRRLIDRMTLTNDFLFHNKLCVEALGTIDGTIALARILLDADDASILMLARECSGKLRNSLDIAIAASKARPAAATATTSGGSEGNGRRPAKKPGKSARNKMLTKALTQPT